MDYLPFIDLAFSEAECALYRGEVPVGAVVIAPGGYLLSKASNCMIERYDQTAHAEILALNLASKVSSRLLLSNCAIYVTLEPCAMCTAIIVMAQIRHLYFGAYDIQQGTIKYLSYSSNFNCYTIIQGGIQERRAITLLKKFFTIRRLNYLLRSKI